MNRERPGGAHAVLSFSDCPNPAPVIESFTVMAPDHASHKGPDSRADDERGKGDMDGEDAWRDDVTRIMPEGFMFISVFDPAGNRSLHPIADDADTRIGRSKDNDILLDDQSVSRHHCKLIKKDGNVRIVDTGSSLGVCVDGKKVKNRQLTNENVIRIGGSTLMLGIHDVAAETGTETSAASPLRRVLLAALVLVLLGTVAALIVKMTPPDLPTVQTVQSVEIEVALRVPFSGSVSVGETVDAVSDVTGRIAEIVAKPGSIVRPGDGIGRLDAAYAADRRATRRAEIDRLRRQLPTAETIAKLKQSVTDAAETYRSVRVMAGVVRGGKPMATDKEVDDAKNKVDAATERYESTMRRDKKLKATIKTLTDQDPQTNVTMLKAAVGGRVVAVFSRPGDVVLKGTRVLKLATTDEYSVTGEFPYATALLPADGTVVGVEIGGSPPVQTRGTLVRTNGCAIRVDLNPPFPSAPGVSDCALSLPPEYRIAVDARAAGPALTQKAERRSIWVVEQHGPDEGTLRSRQISVAPGPTDGDLLVLRGLANGELVAIPSEQLFVELQRVRIVPADGAPVPKEPLDGGESEP